MPFPTSRTAAAGTVVLLARPLTVLVVTANDQRAWTQDGSVSTISFIQHGSVADVLDVLGIAQRDARRITFPEAAPDEELLIGEEPGWIAVLEPNNSLGVRPQVVRAMSNLGRHVALYRSVNSDMAFVAAERGAEVRRFDPLLWPDEQRGEPLAEERGLVFGRPDTPDPYEQAVLLVERVTGARLTRQWLYEVPRRAYRSTW